jgi:hypothetical protein
VGKLERIGKCQEVIEKSKNMEMGESLFPSVNRWKEKECDRDHKVDVHIFKSTFKSIMR